MDVLWLQELSPLHCNNSYLRAPWTRQLNPSPLFTVCLLVLWKCRQNEWERGREWERERWGACYSGKFCRRKKTEVNKCEGTVTTKQIFSIATFSLCMWVSLSALDHCSSQATYTDRYMSLLLWHANSVLGYMCSPLTCLHSKCAQIHGHLERKG